MWVRALPGIVKARLAGRRGLQSAVVNSGWLGLDRLVRLLLALLVGAWVARYLGPAEYGQLAYALALIAFFQAAAGLGADGLVVRDISHEVTAAPQLLGTVLVLRIFAGCLCWLLVILVVMAINGVSDRSVLITAIAGGGLLFQAADTVDLWFQSQSKSGRTVVAKLTAYAVSNGVKVFLVLVEAPLMAFAAVLMLDALAAAAALGVSYRRFPAPGPWRFSKPIAVRYLKEGMPLLLSGISIIAYMRIDQIMIREMLGERALGIYAVALPFCQIWQSIPTILCTSLAPIIARKKAESESSYLSAIVILFRVCFYFGLVSALLMFLLSTLIIEFLFGKEFIEAAEVIRAYSFSNVFCFLGIAHSVWLVNERIFKVRLYGTVLAGIATVISNFFLIPKLGLIGACISAIIAQFIAAVLINGVLDRAGLRLQYQAVLGRWGSNVFA